MSAIALERARPRRGTITEQHVYAVLIALLPFIQIYRVPFFGFGLSTLVIGVSGIYALFSKPLSFSSFRTARFVIAVAIYIMLRSDGSLSNMYLMALLLIHVLAATNGTLNLRMARTTVEWITIISSAGIMLQTLLHYSLRVDLSLVAHDFCLHELFYYRIKIADGLYRPSSFFLEPSHFAQYAILGLISALYPVNGGAINYKRAVFISIAMVLSTSGIGMALLAGVWIWRFSLGDAEKSVKEKSQALLLCLLIGAAGFFVLSRFQFFSDALQRVTGNLDGYNAIHGRTLYWERYIDTLTGRPRIIGRGYLALPDVYLTGYMKILFCYGMIGVFFLLAAFFFGALKTKGFSRCVALVYICMFPFANLTSFIQLTFYLSMIYAACDRQKYSVIGKLIKSF